MFTDKNENAPKVQAYRGILQIIDLSVLFLESSFPKLYRILSMKIWALVLEKTILALFEWNPNTFYIFSL